MKRKLAVAIALTLVLTLGLAGCKQSGSSQSNSGKTGAFPQQKVTIIMPWSVGGGPDTIARKVASYGEKYLGVPVIVENHTGGAGTVAMNKIMSLPSDGYSMVVANGPLFSLTPAFVKTNYKLDQITPLIGMRQVEFVVLSNAKKQGWKSLEDLKKYAEEGHTIKYATTGGPGNDSYTMISVLFRKLGVSAEAVPYDGGQDAINALVGGHVDIAIGSPPVYRDYVKNGELNCLGTFIPEGIEVEGIGKIPSFTSQNVNAEFIGMDYFAVKADVPEEAKKALTEYITKVYADAEFQQFMKEMGMQAWGAKKDEILKEIQKQTEDMKAYIDLLK